MKRAGKRKTTPTERYTVIVGGDLFFSSADSEAAIKKAISYARKHRVVEVFDTKVSGKLGVITELWSNIVRNVV